MPILDTAAREHYHAQGYLLASGLTPSEIAEITGWSESLVKVQAFRARKERRASVERFLMKEKRL